MESKNFKCKFTEMTTETNFKDPQYSINYNTGKSIESTVASYNIISALMEDKDIVMEINTSLFITGRNKSKTIAENFLSEIQKLDLIYNFRNIKCSNRKGFLNLNFGKNKEEEEQEILVYVPNEIWKNNKLYTILPHSGIRYYIVDGNTDSEEDAKTILDDMYKLNDEGKNDYYSMIIFDIVACTQMGIMTKKITASKIKNMLGIYA